MIYSITAVNAAGERLPLVLTQPEDSGLIVVDATGLGPATATINTCSIATEDGSAYNSARVGKRNIVLTLQPMLRPSVLKPSVEEVRHKLYQFFPIKEKVTLEVLTDFRDVAIDGYVESNEVEIFSQTEQAQISILCPNPYFYGREGLVAESLYSTEAAFEFPFSNNSLTESLLEMGSIQTITHRTITYTGDVKTGFVLKLSASGTVTDAAIFNVTTREEIMIHSDKLVSQTGNGFINGDVIEISTVRGDKYAKLYRDGVTYNIVNCLEKDADWFQLENGDNEFAWTAEDGLEYLKADIYYYNRYVGI